MKICIDLGTTTIAVSAVDDKTKLRIEENILNQQRFFGVDVISRIKASMEGNKDMLKDLICQNLIQGISSIAKKSGVSLHEISSITVAANTTMVYLLLGYSCEGLASYPFDRVTADCITLPANEVLGSCDFTCDMTILPGISAFVGGDITAGLLSTQMDHTKELSLLLDLGTNGEMALGTGDRVLTTSTAAGPAFEGGNIKYGMAAIKGAIYQVQISEGRTRFKTIQYGRPIGLCGSGIIDLTAELLRHHRMDATGLLADEYFEDGFPVTLSSNGSENIRFLQSDVREVQTAKAAIRSGIELLCTSYGCQETEIAAIYLAGSFGSAVNIENVIAIGLLPESFRNKIRVVGNTSLQGALAYATNPQIKERLDQIIQKSETLYLSNAPGFESAFIQHLNF